MSGLRSVSKWLVTLGAVNWGLVALFPKYDLVRSIFSPWPALAQVVYLLIGAAGVWGVYAMLTNGKKKR